MDCAFDVDNFLKLEANFDIRFGGAASCADFDIMMDGTGSSVVEGLVARASLL